MDAVWGRFDEFLRRVTQGLPFEPPDEGRGFWVANFGDIELQVRFHDPGDGADDGGDSAGAQAHKEWGLSATHFDEAAIVDLQMVVPDDPELCWQLRLEELAVDPVAQRRQAAAWRSTVTGVSTWEGVVERALAEAVTVVPDRAEFAEVPAPPLGFFPGEEWICLYLTAWHRLGQPISVDWLHSVDQRLSLQSSHLPLHHRVQLSRALWRAGADHLEGPPPAELEPAEDWRSFRDVSEDDPGTQAHRVFLKAALQGRNLVRSHYRPLPAEAVALIDHEETQCSFSVDIHDQIAFIRLRAQLKQGWIGRDFPPTFSYDERINVSDLDDPQTCQQLGRRLQAMDDAWSSRRALIRTAENEASGKTALFRRGNSEMTLWPYFYVLANALDGRKVTPRWIDNVALKFGGWAATAAGPAGSAAARLAASEAEGAATTAGLIALAAQQGVIPTNRPHAFADR